MATMKTARFRTPIGRPKPRGVPLRNPCDVWAASTANKSHGGAVGRASTGVQQARFLAEDGGHVHSRVNKQGNAYVVEMSYVGKEGADDVQIHWGIYRRSPDEWIGVEDVAPEGSSFEGGQGATRTPMQKQKDGMWNVTTRVPAELAPINISFVIIRDGKFVAANSGHNFCAPVGIRRGSPTPLGVSLASKGPAQDKTYAVNFALYSESATGVRVCLARQGKDGKMLEVAFDPLLNKTGRIWHMTLEGLKKPHTLNYGFRISGDLSWKNGGRFDPAAVLLDPYCKLLAPRPHVGRGVLSEDESFETEPMGSLAQIFDDGFDWEADCRPDIPLEGLVIYEMNLEEFTAHSSNGFAGEMISGTFPGVIEKADYLESIGINAILLEPICGRAKGASLGDPPLALFAPDGRFAASEKPGELPKPHDGSRQLKRLVKELHKRGIEVLLQVEFGPTPEGTDSAPKTLGLRGIDAKTYYLQGQDGDLVVLENASALSCNSPAARQLILDCLRHWVLEYHVDGFCFRHAEALTRAHPHGAPDPRPPIVEEIAFDPLLSGVKLFADPWNRSGLPELAGKHLFPHWKQYSEFSPSFNSDAREFTRGTAGSASKFAHALCGTADIFSDGRRPAHCLNAIARYGGVPLADVVSYAQTEAQEVTWNNGVEGAAADGTLLARRLSQVKMMFLVLFLSQGIPVIAMGDETGQTRRGSSRALKRASFRWETLGGGDAGKSGKDLQRFVQQAILFRRKHLQLLQPKEFPLEPAIKWHSPDPDHPPNWEGDACSWPEGPESGSLGSFLAFSILAPDEHDLYVAFNCTTHMVEARPPLTTSPGSVWRRVADTSLPSPKDITLDGEVLQPGAAVHLSPSSALVLEASPAGAP